MQKCVLISSDIRVAQQLRGWFKLFATPPYLETYTSVQAFEEKYEQPLLQKDLMIDEAPQPEALDNATIAQNLEVEASITCIRLLIVDLDTATTKPLDWIVATKDRLRNLGHITDHVGFRTLLLGYDDPHVRPDRFRHEAIDDMVIKPLDQQLFLQKVELLLADKPDVTPTFIFRARAEGDIEIGKDTIVDEVSDFAISVRNPSPIAEGVFAQIHLRVLGSTVATAHALGRCYTSVRHPQYEGLWLVRFSLFGLTNEQLGEIRKFIRGRQMPGRAKLASKGRMPAPPVKNKLPPRYRVAVIDLNRDVLALAQGTIEENFDRTAVTLFPSYTRFLAGLAKLSGHVETSGILDDQEIGVMVFGAIPGGRTTLVISDKDYQLLAFETPLKGHETFLGKDATEWLARPNDWLNSIPKSDHEDFNEFLSYTATGGHGVTGVRFVDGSGGTVYAEVKGRFKPANPSLEQVAELRLDIKQIERDAWLDLNRLVAKGATPDQYRFDAVVIDGGLIRTNPAEWLDGLHGALVRAKVIAATEPAPKIFILADEGSSVQPAQYTHRGISDFIFKPFDRKLLTDKMAIALPNFSRSVLPDASPFVPCELTAQMCKSIPLEELSEYGLTVRYPVPIRPRVFMRFFSKLFGETSDGVLARCTASISSGGTEPFFKCHFVFFGCSDELHKRIRNWIREDYVHKKEANT